MVSDNPDTFFVRIDFMACGRNAMVVQVQQITPIISPITLFISITFIRWHNYQNSPGYKQ